MNHSIVFRCQKCNVKIEADGSYAGNVAGCPNCGNTVMLPAQGVMPGMIIDDFKLDRLLGSGILGEVWEGQQISMHRKVAIKILSPAITAYPRLVARFINEVKDAGKLNHPNIVAAIKAGNKGNIYYLASAYIRGRSIKSILSGGTPMEENQALKLTQSIAEALLYAWEKHNIIHRDLTPDHVIIDHSGKPMLIDIGLSKSLAEDATITRTGLILGSPPYMSTEQVMGKNIDCRADIFSLGALLYNMLTGHPPYDESNLSKAFIKQIKDAFPSTKARNSKVSDQADRLVEIMTAKKRVYRQKDWQAAIEDIKLAQKGKYPETKRPPRSKKGITEHDYELPKLRNPDIIARQAKLHAKNETSAFTKKAAATRSNRGLAIALIAVFLTVMLGVGLFYTKFQFDKSKRIEREKAFARQLREKRKRREALLTQKQKEDKKLANAKKWAFAVAYANRYINSEGRYDSAIKKFQKLKIDLTGSKYEKMAGKAIAMLKKSREKKIASLLKELNEKAMHFANDKKFMQAAAVYKNYAGLLKNNIAAISKEKNSEFEAKAKLKLKRVKKTQKKMREENAQILKAAALNIYNGEIKEALDKIKGRKIFAEPEKALHAIIERKSYIIDSFKDDIGKTLTLKIDGEESELTITAVKKNKVYANRNIGGGLVVTAPFAVKDISIKEKTERLARTNKMAAAIYAGIIAIKREEYRQARQCFRDAGIFSKKLLELVSQNEKQSNLFENDSDLIYYQQP